MKHPRTLCILLAFLACTAGLFAQEVDRDEFSGILDTVINFRNYQGPHDRIDSVSAIRGIGSGLAGGFDRAKDSTRNFGAYRIHHVLGDPAEKGRPADILEFLPSARVDHVDNIRRILAAYLESAYGYNRKDSELLAFYITIYNAVYRGNITYLGGRYRTAVMALVNPENAGLSIDYRDWPGKSRIIIPLGVAVDSVNGDNALSSINSAELVGPAVLDTVKDTQDRNIDKRQDMADLLDRTVDQEQQAIDKARDEIAKAKQDKADQGKTTDGKTATDQGKKPGDTTVADKPKDAGKTTDGKTAADQGKKPGDTTAADKPKDGGKTADTGEKTTDKVADKPSDKTTDTAKDDLARKEEELARRDEQNKETDKAARDLRADTAQDLGKDAGQAKVGEKLLYMETSLKNGLLVSRLRRIDTLTGDTLAEGSDFLVLNREIQQFGDSLLCLIPEGEQAVLALVDPETLAIRRKGSTVISPWSQVRLLPGGTECLAVLQEEGAWHMGRFDAGLNAVARSVIAVDPLGVIQVRSQTILVQRQDGRAGNLDINDLRTAR